MKRTVPALAGLAAVAVLAACGSSDKASAPAATVTATVTESAAASASVRESAQPSTSSTSSTSSTTNYDLADELRASGDYTDKQVTEMFAWSSIACTMQDDPQVAAQWNVKGIQADIQSNYGFTPNEQTAAILRDACK